jgi:hypothetical protein
MASVFKSTAAVNVGVGNVTVLTCPALKMITLIDCSCANVEATAAEVKGTVKHVLAAGPTTAHLIKNGPVPGGSAMVVVGAPRKVVLVAGDKIDAICDKAAGMDVTVSYLEQDV